MTTVTIDDSRKAALLVMPGYGHLTAGAARGFWLATAGDVDVDRHYTEGSLLAQNFNGGWCTALNKKHQGERLDYFAMQHSDIEPEPYWLDMLIAEMEAKSLDVLSVAVPVKDHTGVTSTALSRPDGDVWRPLCRLTMTEIHSLPETFTSEDVGHPLLINTGLWVCRFNMDWCTQVSFTINDRIAFDRGRGLYIAQVEPEDWYFSRLCHELGLKVGCTRKVEVAHVGAMRFMNSQQWGEGYDAAYVDRSQITPTESPESIPLEV